MPAAFPLSAEAFWDFPPVRRTVIALGASNVSMAMVAKSFSSWGSLGRPVVDETGLAGKYDFVLEFTPDIRPTYTTIDSGGPTFQVAVQKQLGLRLESKKAPVDFLVLDHVDLPDAN